MSRRSMRRIALSVVSASLLATGLTACAVGPNYKSPTSPLGVAFNNQPDITARNAAPPAPQLDRWWAGFNDPLLSQFVERALSQNLDIAQASARVDQARAAAHAAGARMLPIGAANGQAARERSSLQSPTAKALSNFPGYQRTGDLYDLNAGASWEIDLFGQLRRNAEAARADAAVAEAGRAGAQLTIAAETADTYLQIRELQARIAIIKRLIAAQTDSVALISQRYGAGAASDLDRQQAIAQLQQVRASLPLMETGLEAQMNRLDVLVADRPGANRAALARPVALPSPPGIAPGDGPAAMLRRRPDVIAAERRLAAANARIGVAMADYWPKVTISGLLGFEATQTRNLFTGSAQLAQGAATGQWRLFDFGLVDAEVKAAKGRRAEALAAWKGTVLSASEDVEDAFTSLVKREAQVSALDAAVVATRTAHAQVTSAYDAGTVSRVEALAAESQYLQSQDGLTQAQAEAARAAVACFRALGGGWKV